MAESPKFPSQPMMWPTFIAAVAALYGWVTYQPDLDSGRPERDTSHKIPAPLASEVIPRVHARLWEDPLEAVYRSQKKAPSGASPLNVECCVDVSKKGNLQDIVRRIHSGVVKTADERPPGDEAKLLVMPVLLPGGPSVDEAERRMRIRYAVLSGLGTCGFQLQYPESMTFFELCAQVRILSSEAPEKRSLKVPGKVFAKDFVERSYDPDNEDTAKNIAGVFVLWIDESRLGQEPLDVIRQVVDHLFPSGPSQKPALRQEPLNAIQQMVNCLCPPKPVKDNDPIKPLIRIIGPSSSDALRLMASENATWLKSTVDKSNARSFIAWDDDARLYSARATVASQYLETKESERLESFTDGASKKSGLRIIRTIGSDLDLACTLKHELSLRGACLTTPRDDECVVLVTEKDTLYGRAFPIVLQHVLKTTNDALCCTPTPLSKTDVVTFRYLRGIDGRVPARRTSQQRTRKDRENTDEESRADPLPTGTAQLDSLVRLEEQLVDIDRSLRRNGGRGITAVGVVGTDLYDKLLILRSLRGRLPGALFFTTDLDAELSHSSEYGTTRNLIVASHYGLKLHPNLQRDVPPFRDSYQTSTFLATLLALDDVRATDSLNGKTTDAVPSEQCRKLWPGPAVAECQSGRFLDPLVFEIGRSGAYQLTTTGGATNPLPVFRWSDDGTSTSDGESTLTASIQPPSPREGTNLATAAFSPLRNRLPWHLAFALIVISIGTLIILYLSGEPRPREYLSKLLNDFPTQDLGEILRTNRHTAIAICIGVVMLFVAILIAGDYVFNAGGLVIRASLFCSIPAVVLIILCLCDQQMRAMLTTWLRHGPWQQIWMTAQAQRIRVITAVLVDVVFFAILLTAYEQARSIGNVLALLIILTLTLPVSILGGFTARRRRTLLRHLSEWTSRLPRADILGRLRVNRTLFAWIVGIVCAILLIMLVWQIHVKDFFLDSADLFARVTVCFVLAGLLTISFLTCRHVWDWLTNERRPTVWTICAVVLLVVFTACVFAADHFRANGEPFTLFKGISIWPTTLMWLMAGALGCYWIQSTHRTLEENFRDQIKERCLTASVIEMADWMAAIGAPAPQIGWRRYWTAVRSAQAPYLRQKGGRERSWSVVDVFRQYRVGTRKSDVAVRVSIATAVFVTFVICFYMNVGYIGYPKLPYRGAVSEWASRGALIFTLAAIAALVFYVIDAFVLCRRFVIALSRSSQTWPGGTVRKMKEKWNGHDDDLRAFLTIRVIADRTQKIGNQINRPFFIFLLLMAARLPVFDNMPVSLTLFTLALCVLLAFILLIRALRRQAGHSRRRALDKLRSNLSIVAGSSKGKEREAQLKLMISEIENEKRGAFRPISEDVVLKWLAVPFGGMGGLLIFEQFFR